jgi:hypothetical protein
MPMAVPNHITGQRFGRLVAVERVQNGTEGVSRWRVQCDCGSESIASVGQLKSGHTESCGCFQRPNLSQYFWSTS